MTKRRTQRGRGSGKDNIIHVHFGPNGGRVPIDGNTAPEQIPPGREPVTDLFSAKEVSKLLGLSATRLRSLDRASIVSPTGSRNGKRAYTFQDLIALRATLMLSEKVKLREVARAIGALRQALPRVTRPLQELRIVSDGRRVVVRSHEGSFEPVTGQMVLDFDVGALRTDVVRVLRPETPADRARTAYDLYVRASSLDEDPASYDEAASLYRRAIEVDPRQPEAHYNLGYVMLERGDARSATAYFEQALMGDPRFADAHFNLAMAWEQLGERGRARPHWRKYLEIEPTGTWADVAREHLKA